MEPTKTPFDIEVPPNQNMIISNILTDEFNKAK